MNIKSAEVRAYRIPTATPEEDGTAHWDSTTMVYVEVTADTGQKEIGFSYASAAARDVIREMLIPAITGGRVEDTGLAWEKMMARVRNAGRPGAVAEQAFHFDDVGQAPVVKTEIGVQVEASHIIQCALPVGCSPGA
jgi:L-alanine-DL-glutamate epimerase-like enolase superfamily enzyme